MPQRMVPKNMSPNDMKIGLLFGSFNPVHTGHLLIASYMADHTGLDKIWFVVSPQNPFKEITDLLDEHQRLQMLQMAIEGDDRFEACDIEFKLDRPSYTINTLIQLSTKYPEHVFIPIVGGDNFQSFHKWKDHDSILEKYEIFVYRREGFAENKLLNGHPKIKFFEVPLLNISSTYIRENIHAGKSISYLVPEKVREFIHKNNLYMQH